MKSSNCPVTRGEVDLEAYAKKDVYWRTLGIAAPARRALVDAKLLKLEHLKKISLTDLQDLHGMGPKAITVLKAEMKKKKLSFKAK